jgi:Tat protein translocase TatC
VLYCCKPAMSHCTERNICTSQPRFVEPQTCTASLVPHCAPPVQGVKFLQLSPGEFFFTTLKVSGYAGLLVATPTVLYEIIAYVIPGLTRNERKILAPVIFGSSILFYLGLLFSYEMLTPAALKFFVAYADGAVESFWSIDQYFEFVLVLMLSTGLAFQARCCSRVPLCGLLH